MDATLNTSSLKVDKSGLENALIFFGWGIAIPGFLVAAVLLSFSFVTVGAAISFFIGSLFLLLVFLVAARVLQYLRLILWVQADNEERKLIFGQAAMSGNGSSVSSEKYGEDFPQQ